MINFHLGIFKEEYLPRVVRMVWINAGVVLDALLIKVADVDHFFAPVTKRFYSVLLKNFVRNWNESEVKFSRKKNWNMLSDCMDSINWYTQ
jgi:hypothetical protein